MLSFFCRELHEKQLSRGQRETPMAEEGVKVLLVAEVPEALLVAEVPEAPLVVEALEVRPLEA